MKQRNIFLVLIISIIFLTSEITMATIYIPYTPRNQVDVTVDVSAHYDPVSSDLHEYVCCAPSPYNIKPGQTISGFSLKSKYPPGEVMFYVVGWALTPI